MANKLAPCDHAVPGHHRDRPVPAAGLPGHAARAVGARPAAAAGSPPRTRLSVFVRGETGSIVLTVSNPTDVRPPTARPPRSRRAIPAGLTFDRCERVRGGRARAPRRSPARATTCSRRGLSFPPITYRRARGDERRGAVLTTAPRVTGRSGNVWIDNGSDRISTASPACPGDAGATVPCHAGADAGRTGDFGGVHAGRHARLHGDDDRFGHQHRRRRRRSPGSEPGFLTNGAFALPQGLRVAIAPGRRGTAPVSNGAAVESPSRSRSPPVTPCAPAPTFEDAGLHPVHDGTVRGRDVDEGHTVGLRPLLLAAALMPGAEASAGTHWVTSWGASTQPDSRRTFNNVTVPQHRPPQRGRSAWCDCGSPTRSAAIRPLAGDAFPETTALQVGCGVRRPARPAARPGVVPETQTPGDVRRAQQTVRISPGTDVVSDPVELPVTDGDNLAVSIYLPGATPNASYHSNGKQTSYLTAATAGTARRRSKTTGFTNTTIPGGSWTRSALRPTRPFGFGRRARRLDHRRRQHQPANTNHRWPDYLAARLNSAKPRTASAAWSTRASAATPCSRTTTAAAATRAGSRGSIAT